MPKFLAYFFLEKLRVHLKCDHVDNLSVKHSDFSKFINLKLVFFQSSDLTDETKTFMDRTTNLANHWPLAICHFPKKKIILNPRY